MYIPCTALQNEDAESHLQTQLLWNIPYEQTKIVRFRAQTHQNTKMLLTITIIIIITNSIYQG